MPKMCTNISVCGFLLDNYVYDITERVLYIERLVVAGSKNYGFFKGHARVLKAGDFLAINIGDVKKSAEKHPDYNGHQLTNSRSSFAWE